MKSGIDITTFVNNKDIDSIHNCVNSMIKYHETIKQAMLPDSKFQEFVKSIRYKSNEYYVTLRKILNYFNNELNDKLEDVNEKTLYIKAFDNLHNNGWEMIHFLAYNQTGAGDFLIENIDNLKPLHDAFMNYLHDKNDPQPLISTNFITVPKRTSVPSKAFMDFENISVNPNNTSKSLLFRNRASNTSNNTNASKSTKSTPVTKVSNNTNSKYANRTVKSTAMPTVILPPTKSSMGLK